MLSKDNLQQLKSIKSDIRNSKDLHRASVRGTRWNYGFARLQDGRDILIPAKEMLKVYPDDDVEVNIISGEKNRAYAKIEKIFKSHLSTFVGRVIIRKQHCFIQADVHGISQNIFVPPPFKNKADNNDLVIAKIIKHPFKEGKAQAKILSIIKDKELPATLEYIAQKFHLPVDKHSDKEIEYAKQQYKNSLEQSHRKNLEAVNFVTIDKENSSDLDDAVFATTTPNGWQLLIAIADPCELIQDNSTIESYAEQLGSSIYFPNHIRNMLPSTISHSLASLLPLEAKPAIVCEIAIDNAGTITNTNIYEAIIRSKAKLSYQDATHIHTQQQTNETALHPLHHEVSHLFTLAQLLNKSQSGTHSNNNQLHYELEVCDKYQLLSISKQAKTPAHHMIETLMITANHCVASWAFNTNITHFPFSVQPGFRASQLTLINQLLHSHAPELDSLDVNQLSSFKQLMQHAQNNKSPITSESTQANLADILNNLLERSTIDSSASAHFTLGLAYYCNFTSPLRRYQDFLAHRCIKAAINKKSAVKISSQQLEQLNETIQRNRQAVTQTNNWLICAWLEKHKQNDYAATVSQMQGNIVNLEITELGVNGYLDMQQLKEYKFNGNKMTFTHQQSRLILGQVINVRLKKIDWNKFIPIFTWQHNS